MLSNHAEINAMRALGERGGEAYVRELPVDSVVLDDLHRRGLVSVRRGHAEITHAGLLAMNRARMDMSQVLGANVEIRGDKFIHHTQNIRNPRLCTPAAQARSNPVRRGGTVQRKRAEMSSAGRREALRHLGEVAHHRALADALRPDVAGLTPAWEAHNTARALHQEAADSYSVGRASTRAGAKADRASARAAALGAKRNPAKPKGTPIGGHPGWRGFTEVSPGRFVEYRRASSPRKGCVVTTGRIEGANKLHFNAARYGEKAGSGDAGILGLGQFDSRDTAFAACERSEGGRAVRERGMGGHAVTAWRKNPLGADAHGFTQGFLQGHAEWGTPTPDEMRRAADPYAVGYRKGRHAASASASADGATAGRYHRGELGSHINPRGGVAVAQNRAITQMQIDYAAQLLSRGDAQGAKPYIESVYQAAHAARPAKWAQAFLRAVAPLRVACEAAGVPITRYGA